MAKPVRFRNKWRIRWFDEKGTRQSALFDTKGEATYQNNKKLTEVAEIERGLRSTPPTAKSFNELCDKFLFNRTSQKRRPRDDESTIRVHLRPFFGPSSLSALCVEQIDQYKLSKRHLHPKTVHHHLTLLITMLRYAQDLKWLVEVPKIKKPKITLFEKDFRFLRTHEEISRFLRAAQSESQLAFTLYITAVYTGLREGEVAGLKWTNVNFERRLITIQNSYNGPTKSGDIRHIPILDPLLPVLRSWRLVCQGELIFPNEAGKMHQESARIFQEIFHRVLDRAKFPKVERNGKLLRYIVFHDLRHTFASHWVMNGGDLFKLQKILGHKTVQMTMRYAHLAPEAFSSEYGRLGSRYVSGPATVTEIPRSFPCAETKSSFAQSAVGD